MLKFLQDQGFVLLRVRGSHHYLQRGDVHVSLPVHGNQNLKTGTLRSILRDIDMAPLEFAALYRG